MKPLQRTIRTLATCVSAGWQQAQETGEGTYEWPPEMDPKNPTGVERDRPVPGGAERKVATAGLFEREAAVARPSEARALRTALLMEMEDEH